MNGVMSSVKQPGYVKTATLLLIAFGTAFFSRLLDTAGAPSMVNFLHFAAIPVAFGVALAKTRTTNRSQISTVQKLLAGIGLLLMACFASALWNNAGAINAILSFLLLAEPFMLLVAIASLYMPPIRFEHMQKWMTRFVFFHLFLIYLQFAAGFCHMEGHCDNVQGVFYRSGSGHVVGASVSCTFAIYYFMTAKAQPLWLRVVVLLAGFGNILTSDAKQVLLTFALALILLAIFNLKDVGKVVVYLIGITVFLIIFSWAIQNIPALGAFKTWIRPEIYGPDGEATKLKLSGIRIILEHYTSPINWLVGLGPGHTIGRLGGWMIRDYNSLLAPLGATMSPVPDQVWAYVASSWLAEGSSMFAPFIGWAGIWGDLGFLGLGAYLYLCVVTWQDLCLDDTCKYLMLTVLVFGLIFTQMEEPGYMLYVAGLIGLRWQEHQVQRQNRGLETA